MKMYGQQFYISSDSNIPYVFREADRIMAEKHKNDPEIVKEPIVVPMPFIKGCPGANGPIVVTKDWYVKTEKNRLASLGKEKRIMQQEMMDLLARRDRIRAKLGELNPAKKEDSKQIVKLNIKLKDIQAELEMLQDQSHVDLNELDHGTRFDRFIGRIKNFFRRIGKAIKKFFNKNKEVILGVTSVIAPVVISAGMKKLVRAFA